MRHTVTSGTNQVTSFSCASFTGHRALPIYNLLGWNPARTQPARPGGNMRVAHAIRVGIHSQRPCVNAGCRSAWLRVSAGAHSGVVKAMARRITPHIQPSECARGD